MNNISLTFHRSKVRTIPSHDIHSFDINNTSTNSTLRDKDGVMGVEELAFVIQHILCKTHTEEQALAIVERLDLDGDGKISVQELMGFVDEYSDSESEEVLNV